MVDPLAGQGKDAAAPRAVPKAELWRADRPVYINAAGITLGAVYPKILGTLLAGGFAPDTSTLIEPGTAIAPSMSSTVTVRNYTEGYNRVFGIPTGVTASSIRVARLPPAAPYGNEDRVYIEYTEGGGNLGLTGKPSPLGIHYTWYFQVLPISEFRVRYQPDIVAKVDALELGPPVRRDTYLDAGQDILAALIFPTLIGEPKGTKFPEVLASGKAAGPPEVLAGQAKQYGLGVAKPLAGNPGARAKLPLAATVEAAKPHDC